MTEVEITFSDGTKKKYPKYTTYYDISKEFKMPKEALAVMVDNKIKSLSDRAERNHNIEFLDINSTNGNRIYLSGLKMLFEYAATTAFPGIGVTFAFSLPRGIIAELDYRKVLGNDDINLIRKAMNNIVAKNIEFEKLIVSSSDAVNYFMEKNNEVKVDNINNIIDSTVTLYRLGDFLNYYYTEMPHSTSALNKFEVRYLGKNIIVLNFPKDNDKGKIPDYIDYKCVIDTYLNSKEWLNQMHVPYIKDINNVVSNGKIGNFIRSSELNFNMGINETAKHIAEHPEIKFVMISGPSSSGKTTVTKRLANYFEIYGLHPIVISIDDYFKERVDTPKDANGEYDFECLEALDLDYLKKDVKKLLAGEEINLPRFNFLTGKKELTNKKAKITDGGIVLFEGLHAINDKLIPIIPNEKKYKIYISPYIPLCIDKQNYISERDLRLLRRMVRDFRTRGYGVESTIKSSKKVKEGEIKWIIPHIHEANKIINTSLAYEVGVLKVYVEPLLYSVKADSPYYNEARRLLNFLKQFFTISSEFIPNDSILREFIGGGIDD